MKREILVGILMMLLILPSIRTPVVLAADESPEPRSGVLEIDIDGPKRPISRMLYGVFYEDINYAGDGGLYAELVRNRSFEHLQRWEGWGRINDQDSGRIAVENTEPLNDNNRNYVRLESDNTGRNLALINYGYGGIAIREGGTYDFSVYARCDGFDGRLLVSLEDSQGRVVGEASVSGITGDWQRYKAEIQASETSDRGRLVIRVNEPGTVFLDMVSLFPRDTWMGRENGLRSDLVEMLADLKPAFIRFPGGCIVEGNSIVNAYRWKDTIGDVAARKTNSNLWGYYQSYGLGFHEYFLLCEDLGAEPVPILNAGLSCQVRGAQYVPMNQLDEWVQDALDLIEYAKGPVDSPWGSVRAANGHPEPFNLEYLGIGNENWGPEYHKRYEVFHKAIKEKYPDIKLISGSGVAYDGPDYDIAKRWAESIGVDVFDEHMYCPPQWFFSNADRYDDYERGEMVIFVGEYAAHGTGRRNNLEAALAEAAFMTGLERNSDIVHMTAYAPLFNKVGSSQWTPDLIWFNNTDVYGTPSYYVQKMFGTSLGDIVLPCVYQAEASVVQEEPISGKIGLGSWRTRVEFDWVKVTAGDTVLLYDDFEEQTVEWESRRGRWQQSDGLMKQLVIDDNCRTYAGNTSWDNYTLEVRARKVSGAEGMLIPFGVKDNNNYYWWNLGGWNNTVTAIEKAIGGQKMVIGDRVGIGIEAGRWYDIKVELSGRTIRCYLDGELIHEIQDEMDGRTFYVACSRDYDTGDVIIKAVNRSSKDQTIEIRLDGDFVASGKGYAQVLTSENLADENSFEQPEKVAPVVRELTGLGSTFSYTFDSQSVTVLRIQKQLP